LLAAWVAGALKVTAGGKRRDIMRRLRVGSARST
jgi:hypothetical protein